MGTTKDSQKHQTFPSGAKRNSQEGKGRFDLISPFIFLSLAFRLEDGVSIYGARNWEKGIPLSRFVSAAFRHLIQASYGMVDEDHWGGVIYNVMCLKHGIEMIESGKWPDELNDLPNHSKELERLWNARNK